MAANDVTDPVDDLPLPIKQDFPHICLAVGQPAEKLVPDDLAGETVYIPEANLRANAASTKFHLVSDCGSLNNVDRVLRTDHAIAEEICQRVGYCCDEHDLLDDPEALEL